MILVSQNLQDNALVTSTIRSRSLSPDPVKNHWELPGAFFSAGNLRKSVKTYRWGKVVTASDLRAQPYQHITAVVIHEAAEVEEDAVTMEIAQLAPWYRDIVAEEFKEAPEIPICIGRHTSSRDSMADRVICEGGENPETQEREEACQQEGRCLKFQHWCRVNQSTPSKWLAEHHIKEGADNVIGGAKALELVTFIDALDEPDEEAEEEDGEPRDYQAEVMQLIHVLNNFFNSLAKRLKRSLVVNQKLAQQGDLFMVDKKETSNYISLYSQQGANLGAPLPICQVRLKPMLGALDVYLPVSEMTPHLDCFRGRIRERKIGNFEVFVRVQQDIDLPLMEEAVVKMIADDTIPLAVPYGRLPKRKRNG